MYSGRSLLTIFKLIRCLLLILSDRACRQKSRILVSQISGQWFLDQSFPLLKFNLAIAKRVHELAFNVRFRFHWRGRLEFERADLAVLCSDDILIFKRVGQSTWGKGFHFYVNFLDRLFGLIHKIDSGLVRLRLVSKSVHNFGEFLEFFGVQVFIWWSRWLLAQVLFSCLLELWKPLIYKWLVSLLICLTPRLILVDSVKGHSIVDKGLVLSVSRDIIFGGLDMDGRFYNSYQRVILPL